MKIRFLKKLAKNLFYVFGNFGIMYSFHIVAEKYTGEGLYGLLAYLGFLMILIVTGMSWSEALFDERWGNGSNKAGTKSS
tara:strand:+ start:355 stop:594 length:240 start_codon:yes stop_codon:yes gene_type:complete